MQFEICFQLTVQELTLLLFSIGKEISDYYITVVPQHYEELE
jgi:hypothetical protein